MRLKKVPVTERSVAGYASCICVNATCSTCTANSCWCGCMEDIDPSAAAQNFNDANLINSIKNNNINAYYASQNRH